MAKTRPQTVCAHLPGAEHPFQLPWLPCLGLTPCPIEPPMHGTGSQTAALSLLARLFPHVPHPPPLLAPDPGTHSLRHPPQAAAPMHPLIHRQAMHRPHTNCPAPAMLALHCTSGDRLDTGAAKCRYPVALPWSTDVASTHHASASSSPHIVDSDATPPHYAVSGFATVGQNRVPVLSCSSAL